MNKTLGLKAAYYLEITSLLYEKTQYSESFKLVYNIKFCLILFNSNNPHKMNKYPIQYRIPTVHVYLDVRRHVIDHLQSYIEEIDIQQ